MSRSNKGIRDMVKETRGVSTDQIGNKGGGEMNGGGRIPTAQGSANPSATSTNTGGGMMNPKMAKISGGVYSSVLNGNGMTSSAASGNLLKQKSNNLTNEVNNEMFGFNANEFMKDVDQVNKLNSVTAKLFPTPQTLNGQKQQDENFLPEIKDGSIAGELRRRIDEQRKELEHRNNTVQALQRNFESLSTLCMNERVEKTALQKINEQLKGENKDMAGQLLQRIQQVEALQKEVDSFQKEKKKMEKMKEEFSTIKTQLESAKQQIEVKNQKIEKIEQDNQALKQQLKDLKASYNKFDEILKDNEKLRDELRQQIKEKDKQIEQQQVDISKQQIGLQEKDEIISLLKREVEDQKSKLNEQLEKFNKKLQLIKEYESDLERERQLKSELEKQINQLKNTYDSQNVMLQTNKSSSEELKSKFLELTRQNQNLQIDVERYQREIDQLNLELNEVKNQFKRGAGDLQKELLLKKDQIQSLEQRIGSDASLIQRQEKELNSLQSQIELKETQIRDLVDQMRKMKEKEEQLILNIEDLKTQLKLQGDNYQIEKQKLREEYLATINSQKEEIQQLRQQLRQKEQENGNLKKKVEELQSQLEKNQNDSSNRSSDLIEELNSLRKQQQKLQDQVLSYQSEIEMLKQQLENNSKKSTSSNEEWTKLKLQLDEQIQNLSLAKNQKSEITVKMEQMQKDKRQLEYEISQLRNEKKELQKEAQDWQKKHATLYERFEDAIKKIGQLEKDIELQEEVIKKRHTEINSLLKENTAFKNQIDDIRRKYGDLEQIESRIKIATLKEEKINTLISKLDHVMSSTENNLSCYQCMNLLSDPCLLVPCSHTYCKNCIKNATNCPECEKSVKAIVQSKLLADLVNKYQFNKDAINTFKTDSVWKNILDK